MKMEREKETCLHYTPDMIKLYSAV